MATAVCGVPNRSHPRSGGLGETRPTRAVARHVDAAGRSRGRIPNAMIRTGASVAEKAGFAALPVGWVVADVAEAGTAVGSAPAGVGGGPAPFSPSPPHARPVRTALTATDTASFYG